MMHKDNLSREHRYLRRRLEQLTTTVNVNKRRSVSESSSYTTASGASTSSSACSTSSSPSISESGTNHLINVIYESYVLINHSINNTSISCPSAIPGSILHRLSLFRLSLGGGGGRNVGPIVASFSQDEVIFFLNQEFCTSCPTQKDAIFCLGLKIYIIYKSDMLSMTQPFSKSRASGAFLQGKYLFKKYFGQMGHLMRFVWLRSLDEFVTHIIPSSPSPVEL